MNEHAHPPVPGDHPVGHLIASRYEIRGVLGRGAAGTVYRTHDRVLDEPVAVKVMRSCGESRPEMAGRFRSEIKLARRVAHPNVCRIYEYGEDESRPFLSMELIEGCTVKERLRQAGPYTPDAALAVAIQVADALAAIHRAGVVHRDLKPQNLIESPEGLVKVTDFGVASPRAMAAADLAGIPRGYVVGTPEYMSPEQARGLEVGARSDLYALGIVLFEMLTGDVPFRGETASATLARHVREPPPLSGAQAGRIPAILVPLLERALAKRPKDRPRTAAVMAEELRKLRQSLPGGGGGRSAIAAPQDALGLTTTLTQPGRHFPTGEHPSRRWTALAGAIVVLLTALSWPVPARRSVVSDRGRTEPQIPTTRERRGTTLRAQAKPPSDRDEPAPEPPDPSEDSVPADAYPVADLPPIERSTTADEAAIDPERDRSPRDDAPPPADADEGDEEGWLQFGVRPWAYVSLDGHVLGTTPLKVMALAPGTYTVRLDNPDYRPLTRKIQIRSGETTPLRVDLAQDAVRR